MRFDRRGRDPLLFKTLVEAAGIIVVLLALLAMTTVAGCGDTEPNDPQSVTETGYLSCAADAAECPDAALCAKADESHCLDLPEDCAGKITCACLGKAACGSKACHDGADGNSLSCGDKTDPSDSCTPGDTFEAADGCNTCTCPDSGKTSEAMCTLMGCVYNACADKACGDACNPCDPAGDPATCATPGVPTSCNAAGECVPFDVADCETTDPNTCTPGDVFEAPDGCNSCTCPASGKKDEAGCTEKACVWAPCTDKKCGTVCSICDPTDPSCAQPDAETLCNDKGECVIIAEGDLLCPDPNEWEPCKGKTCGDECAPCDPTDPDCALPGTSMACNKGGECVPADPAVLDCGPTDPDACTPGEVFPTPDDCNTCTCPESGKKSEAICSMMPCVEWVPCKDKACGAECFPCDPADPDCALPGVQMVCNKGGECVSEDPSALDCGSTDPNVCTPGGVFEAPDGCNTCTCPASGKKDEAACTEMACIGWEPCKDKACGDVCSPCDPADPDCPIADIETLCDDGGACVEGPVACKSGPLCGADGAVFPDFDDSCTADADCAVVFHQVNCCGTNAAWGVNVSEVADFQAAEAICVEEYPKCGCATFPTTADDGKSTWYEKNFVAACQEGACKTSVLDGCHTMSDCDGTGMCVAPGQSLGCGACMMPESSCANDAACQATNPTSICKQSTIDDCLCESAMICKPGCASDASCATGEFCDADMHCKPKTCAADAGCPPNFTCAAGACKRSACVSDENCDGFCVMSQCYATLGWCGWPPP